MSDVSFRTIYDLSFQVSPIILTGGSIAGVPGAALPIIALIGELAGFGQGYLTSNKLTLDDFSYRWVPMAGTTVLNNSVAVYPFANQHVAANAYIEEPLNLSLEMIAPVKDTAGYLTKLALFTALRNACYAHITAGGTFGIATPSYIFTDCLLTSIVDITGGDTHQQQVRWRWDFFKPLITQSQAQAAKNGLIQALSGGQQVTGSTWSDGAAATGISTTSLINGVAGLNNTVSGALSGGI